MISKLGEFRVSVRQLFLVGLVLGIPYGAVGLIWALTHTAHLADLDGVDRLFSFLGEIVAWPVLLFSDITLR